MVINWLLKALKLGATIWGTVIGGTINDPDEMSRFLYGHSLEELPNQFSWGSERPNHPCDGREPNIITVREIGTGKERKVEIPDWPGMF